MRSIEEYMEDADAFLTRAVESVNEDWEPWRTRTLTEVADVHLRMANTLMRQEGR